MTGNPTDRTGRRGAGAALDPVRFAQLLDAYGAAPERWPAAERDAALALLAASETAQAAHAAAARLDALLDLAPAEAPSAALVARVLAAAPRGGESRRGPAGWLAAAARALWPGAGPVWRPAAALAAAAVLGLAVGLAVPPHSNSNSGWSDLATTEVDTLAFGGIAVVESES